MFLLGFFSIIQIAFLPGYLLLKFMKLESLSLIQKLVFTLGASLYLNYQLVLILTYFNIYKHEIVLFIFVIEVITFGFFLIREKVWEKYFSINSLLRSLSFNKSDLLLKLCGLSILFYTGIFFANLDTVFYYSDTINTWNRCATEWANNAMPVNTFHYPQLISSNMSLSYVFIQNNEVSFFAKSFMPIIFISILLMFYDMGIRNKNKSFFVGLIVYALMMPILYSLIFIADGNTEIAVSFFGFLTYYSLFNYNFSLKNRKLIYLAAIFSSSAALTKLAGLYVVLLFCLWLSYCLIKSNPKLFTIEKFKLFVTIMFILIFNLLWYIIKPMSAGLNQSNYLTPDFYSRFLHAFELLKGSLGLPILLTFMIGVMLSLFVRRVRLITLILVIPVLLIWTFFYSYDTRNLNISLPFIALVTPFGFEFLLNGILKKINLYKFSISQKKSKHIRTSVLIGMAVLIFVSFNLNYLIIILEKINTYARIYFFGSFRINYTVELGYYRYVEYFVDAIRILCIIVLGCFLLCKYEIKIKYMITLTLLSLIILSFTILSRQQIINKQNLEEELITIRNISTISKLYSANNENDLILTNYPKLDELAFAYNLNYSFSKNLLMKNINENQFTSLLFYKKIPLQNNLDLSHFEKFYENSNFVFFMRKLD